MEQTYKQTFSNLTKDLTEVKKAKFKEKIFGVIFNFHSEMRNNHDNFKEAFLSSEADKYFLKLKEAIGEFKHLKEMNVLIFLCRVVVGG